MSFIKKRILIISGFIFIPIFLSLAGYYGLEKFLEWYIMRAARKLVEQENRGELSRDYGYVWSEINEALKMQRMNHEISSHGIDTVNISKEMPFKETGSINRNMPSLIAIRELNKIHQVSNFILITDRHDYPLAEIKTTHTRLPLKDFNDVLIKAIIYSEDKNFYTRTLAWEYRAFVRAFIKSILHGIRTFSLPHPRGTSTIHQQVAKFMLSRFDKNGYVYLERSISRKINELKLAQALKMYFTQDELLQVYLNHCVNAGYGMTGYYDISKGLFGKKPSELDICQSLYLARLVKWNKNIPQKIITQIKVDMPRMAPAMGWGKIRQDSIITALGKLKFLKPMQIVSEHNPLIDLANEYWLDACRLNRMPEDQLADMDFSLPNTMIRTKGNLKIRLTIDLRLQRLLESMVDKRGFGRDTIIRTDVRIGSFGEDVRRSKTSVDTMRLAKKLSADSMFAEPQSRFSVKIKKGDTLVTNIRYREIKKDVYRRSLYFYKRDTLHVNGQYYAYSLMNSSTGELLAYYSRDGIGSRLSSLLKNKTPNGSSVAKPILYGLNYDFGHFNPYDMLDDSVEVSPPLAWARKFLLEKNRNIGMIYLNTSAPGGYPVSNHGKTFEGYDYIFNHLTESNNIICVEMIYRLNTMLFGSNVFDPKATPAYRLLERIGDTTIIGSSKEPSIVTGTQIYARIAAISGADVDTIRDMRGRIPLPPDYYSVALGTLELSLYQQMHLFNVLYNNEIIVNPENHPGLVIKGISISGDSIGFSDSIERRRVFEDIENLRPVQLGLHKRLVSNVADNLERFDIALDNSYLSSNRQSKPLSNFAKSGTSDDIIRPYNKDVTTREKANYGLWNAVLRLSLPARDYDGLSRKSLSMIPDTAVYDSVPEQEILDVTLSCVGECNEKNTGAMDGKSLHKYVSAGFLNRYGIISDSGFYRQYENQVLRSTPDSVLFLNPFETPDIAPELIGKIIKKTENKKRGDRLFISKGLFFGFYLSDESYLWLLSYTLYFGKQAGKLYELVEALNDTKNLDEMISIIGKMKVIEAPKNPYLIKSYTSSLEQLLKSISEYKH